jgi:aryl-alcohol dehydrogenase-like predicted oxidoreductase
MVKKRQLGSGGPWVHPIGFGAMSFGGFYGKAEEPESLATLARAVDLGVDFIDVADVYGHGYCEELLGRFLKGRKERIVIATKGAIKRRPGTTERVFDNSPAYMRSALEASLKRLQLDRVDLYYIHRRDPSVPIETAIEGMVALKEAGLIGGIGLSEVAPATIRRAHAVHPVMAVQSEYSLWTRTPELGVIETCRELGIAFVPFGALGRKFFTGKLTSVAGFEPNDFRRTVPRFIEPNFTYNLRLLQPFLEHARRRAVTPGQLALAWCLAKGQHIIHIPGTRHAAHVAENVHAASLALSREEIAEIEQILPAGFAHGDRYSDAQWVGPERYG